MHQQRIRMLGENAKNAFKHITDWTNLVLGSMEQIQWVQIGQDAIVDKSNQFKAPVFHIVNPNKQIVDIMEG